MVDILTKAKAAMRKAEQLGFERNRIFTSFDPGRILADAKRLSTLPEGTRKNLPLFGLLVSVKDLFDEAGERNTAGSRLLKEREPATTDAEAVRRLKAAGALMFGRTTLSEFAYSGVGLNPHYGTPGNVFDPTRIPGGSTSGGALTVAHGICDVALGTDTGGSVRIPAAINGLYGYKPTQSTVPREGVHPLAKTYDSIGPLTRDLETAIRTFAILSGGIVPEPSRGQLRLAVPQNAFVNDVDDTTREQFEQAKSALRKAGHDLVGVDFGFLASAIEINRIIVSVEAHALYEKDLEKLESVGDPRVLRRIRFAETLTADEIEEAYTQRSEVARTFGRMLEGFDALIAPTLAAQAPTIKEAEEAFDRINAVMLRNCSLINWPTAAP